MFNRAKELKEMIFGRLPSPLQKIAEDRLEIDEYEDYISTEFYFISDREVDMLAIGNSSRINSFEKRSADYESIDDASMSENELFLQRNRHLVTNVAMKFCHPVKGKVFPCRFFFIHDNFCDKFAILEFGNNLTLILASFAPINVVGWRYLCKSVTRTNFSLMTDLSFRAQLIPCFINNWRLLDLVNDFFT
ncbi:hypothetical protein ROZALSC1DRAFT_23993 [Rozella allomycis CSF55]|uniref:Uncharacterized protein n=1 Tax=Rozella allomycis (strain CSF55) TaxID=988480 RepID=A0A4V1IZD2_ROZAC|nr:hypothetical protein ROZALSC1DRAFT_23993 [Rozella allomycis CSF55]